MMGSYSLWLMLVARLVALAFLPLICIGSVHFHDDQHSIIVKEDCRLTFLLVIKNNESGLQLDEYLFPGDHEPGSGGVIRRWPDLELEHRHHDQMHFIPSLWLSSACGDQYFRCQQLLVKTFSDNGEEISIVFIPLETGLLLLSYRSIYTTLKLSTSIVNSSDCSPTVVYHISSNFYMVCVSSHQYVAVYELEVLVNLNSSMIEGAVLFGPLINVNISYSPSSSHLSNFIIVDHQIYFAIGNTTIVMDILDTKQTQMAFPELPQCTQIHKLVHVPTVAAGLSQPNIMLVAYCSDRYIYFDPVHREWTNIYLFSSNGIPYLCPNNSHRATLYMNGTLKLSSRDIDSLAKTSTINNVNISSGICFESQNRTYFAYSDQRSNIIFAYDFTSQNHHIVSSYNCSRLNCPQLLLLENQYLVVRDDRCDIFLDVKKNFSLFINTSSGIADVLAILHLHITPGPSPHTQNSTIITTATPGKFIYYNIIF